MTFFSKETYFPVGSLCNGCVLFPKNILHKENNYFGRHFLKYKNTFPRKIFQHLMPQTQENKNRFGGKALLGTAQK